MKYEKEKINFIKLIVDLDQKKIMNKDIREAAKKANLNIQVARYTLNNFLKYGVINKYSGSNTTVSNNSNNLTTHVHIKKSINKMSNKEKFINSAKLIKGYIDGKMIRELIIDYNMSITKIYNIINNFSFTGELCGKTVFDIEKYRRVDLKDIRSMLHNNSCNFNEVYKLQLQRQLTILEKYLFKKIK